MNANVTCQITGVEFEAKSARVKNHPEISAVLTEANKTNRYGIALQAIQNAREAGVTEIGEFVTIAREAVKANRAIETAEARKRLAERYARETERVNRIQSYGFEPAADEREVMTAADEREVAAKMVAVRTSEF